jgi:glutathione peroxidase
MEATKSIYDIPIKSWDDKADFLSKYKGKVTLIVNVTANCGNAPQLKPLEEIYQKYKDRGFEIAAIPTNDYCGPGITYDKWVDGITCANDARMYAIETYAVTYDFSEMITSQVDEYWRKKRDNWRDPHPLYEALTPKEFPMGGNFEKFLVDREGNLVKRFPNFTLLDYYYENVKNGVITIDEHDHEPLTAEQAYELICSEIEKLL